jgi:beta,beta-carotene 9',10'-dioxygenase
VEKGSGCVVGTAQRDAFFAFHHVNAFEDGGDVVVDMVAHPDATVIDRLYLDRLRSAESIRATGMLTRLRIPLGANRARDGGEPEPLSSVPLELPRFDYRRRAGRRHRFVYGASDVGAGDFLDSLVKLDLERGTSCSWQEDGCYPGEPVFVEAPEGEREDEGVVLSVVLDTRRSASFLLVLDAQTFEELARAEAPHHIPFGFHGQYFTGG